MKAKAFDEIYNLIAKEPMVEITSRILCKLFKDNKKFKLTNSMLLKLREQTRPHIISALQESFDYEAIVTKYNTYDARVKFLNQFYLFNGFNKYFENLLKQNKEGIQLLSPS